VYPALTVLQALNKIADRQSSWLSTLWVGGVGGMEADLVKRENVPFKAIPAAGVHGVGLRAMPGNLAQLGRGYFASRKILRSFKPDVMFFTGGYVAVPMALAGQGLFHKKTPSVLFAPDIEPGLALKAIASSADRIAVINEDSLEFYSRKERVIVTGYPVRSDLVRWSREQAFQALNLAQDLPVLLVLGGSTGAQSINQALVKALPVLLAKMQIIHIAGQRNWSEVQATSQELEPDLAQRYHLYPYLHGEMGAALRAADLVLSRAGASCLGEYPAFGLPAILAPYPYAWRYQQVNAEYLSKHGAAIILADADLLKRLSDVALDLIQDTKRLDQMRSAMLGLARPSAAHQIAEIVDSLAMEGHSDS
jgi:UDP-N-acetylglucosamine--N-acetylmuramyl-(pentapeptide) pyrophosphoryl-undecaprenol N-acetylglucosamine transferase